MGVKGGALSMRTKMPSVMVVLECVKFTVKTLWRFERKQEVDTKSHIPIYPISQVVGKMIPYNKILSPFFSLRY